MSNTLIATCLLRNLHPPRSPTYRGDLQPSAMTTPCEWLAFVAEDLVFIAPTSSSAYIFLCRLYSS